jgi:hypothetical protein
MHVGTRYVELIFLHPVGCSGHFEHSGEFRVRNIDVLFFMLGGTDTDSTKSALGHITLNSCFASGGMGW